MLEKDGAGLDRNLLKQKLMSEKVSKQSSDLEKQENKQQQPEETHSSSESQSEPLLYCNQTDSFSTSQGTAYFGALGSKRTCQLEKLQQKVGEM